MSHQQKLKLGAGKQRENQETNTSAQVKKAKFHCSRPEAVSSESGEDDDELPVEPVDEGEKGEHEQKEGEDSGANLKSVLNIVL